MFVDFSRLSRAPETIVNRSIIINDITGPFRIVKSCFTFVFNFDSVLAICSCTWIKIQEIFHLRSLPSRHAWCASSRLRKKERERFPIPTKIFECWRCRFLPQTMARKSIALVGYCPVAKVFYQFAAAKLHKWKRAVRDRPAVSFRFVTFCRSDV